MNVDIPAIIVLFILKITNVIENVENFLKKSCILWITCYTNKCNELALKDTEC